MALSRRIRNIALLIGAISLCLTMSACADSGDAAPQESVDAAFSVPSPPTADEPPAYQDVRVYFDGLLTDRGYLDGETVFLSPEAICAYYGLELEFEQIEGGFCMKVPGLELYARQGQEYMQANSRYLYTPSGYLTVDGQIYLPMDVVERIFGLSVTLSGEPLQADISTTGISIIQGGEGYYELNYPSEDMYWLSHIIYAEARDEPMAGLIGVGNVVFNRVQSDDFPDTVFDVIFDREHVVQFEPVATGGVLGEPDQRSVIAACLCFEGYNTVGDSLFFVNPALADSQWFESSLSFVTTIGGHNFYA